MIDEKTNISSHVSLAAELTNLNSRELAIAVARMNLGQKQLLALKGNATVRRILLRDPNPEVQLAMVNSPKASESEIEQLAALASSTEIVLKTISSDGRWLKSYRIKLALARNPKTPLSIASRCMKGLTAHDLRKLSGDPNTKKAVAMAAQRLLNNHR